MDVRLKDEELQDPFLALDRVFSHYKLVEIRIELESIRKKHFQKSFLFLKTTRSYDNTLHFFEQLDKLIQASYLLHENHFKSQADNRS